MIDIRKQRERERENPRHCDGFRLREKKAKVKKIKQLFLKKATSV